MRPLKIQDVTKLTDFREEKRYVKVPKRNYKVPYNLTIFGHSLLKHNILKITSHHKLFVSQKIHFELHVFDLFLHNSW